MRLLSTSVRGLEMPVDECVLIVPVVRVPSCARGAPCVFVYCTCTTELSIVRKERIARSLNLVNVGERAQK